MPNIMRDAQVSKEWLLPQRHDWKPVWQSSVGYMHRVHMGFPKSSEDGMIALAVQRSLQSRGGVSSHLEERVKA